MELAGYFNAGGGGRRVRVIESLGSRWLREFWLSSIVVGCIPAHSVLGGPPAEFRVPEGWLGSPTGGVCVGVCTLVDSLLW